ncbi:hypothetical protein [Mucilaginibacter sp.]|uniref:hypothetical protein n=1 Tax=Mucilaginibacter sp. TaxID=1882438 RepID=UPI00260210E7|nr:hypothetical protein [Mucilaginibacter sp.]MDB4918296.1 hypothetical protein [Mucilaginibacter sp.]
MFSNFRYPIILFMLSLAGLMIGMAFKILHWPGGQLITGSMIMVQVLSIVWLIIIIVKSPKS